MRFVVLALLAVACAGTPGRDGGVAGGGSAGSGGSGGAAGGGFGGGSGGSAGCNGTETFTAARTAMLGGCTGFGPMTCHGRAPFAGELDLTLANAHAQLVNVPASIAPGKLRVAPGDPAGSFLIQKLTNRQAANEGTPMPQGEGIMWRPPNPDDLRVVECWIRLGANNN